jgi:hypothetical protein
LMLFVLDLDPGTELRSPLQTRPTIWHGFLPDSG